MAVRKRLLVGLGNPGEKYEETRHNIGFKVIDLVAENTHTAFHYDKRAGVLVGEGRHRGCPFVLAKPMLYMNCSGAPVKHLMRRYGIQPTELLVIADDINLKLGQIRIRERGSAGGHNGVQDIIDALGISDFPRLRMGVGKDFLPGRQSDYVLSSFFKEEKPVINEALGRAAEAILTYVSEGIAPAMSRFNS